MRLKYQLMNRNDPDLGDVTRYVCIVCDIVIAIDSGSHDGEHRSVCNWCIELSDENHATYVMLRGLDHA